jgi:hypothetical protein
MAVCNFREGQSDGCEANQISYAKFFHNPVPVLYLILLEG